MTSIGANTPEKTCDTTIRICMLMSTRGRMSTLQSVEESVINEEQLERKGRQGIYFFLNQWQGGSVTGNKG